MGEPKKIRKKYSTPSHPWQKERIEEEKALKREYGLRTKKEIWVANSQLENFKSQVKKLNALFGEQAEKEQAQMKERLKSLGLLKADQELDAVLALTVRDILERRLQTIIYKKNLARSITQARQFVTHRHITVKNKKITVPSYLVRLSEEESIGFSQSSAMADPNHPERYEQLPEKKEDKSKKLKQSGQEDAVAFDDIKDEEEIVKDIKPKKTAGATKDKDSSANSKQEAASEEKKKETKDSSSKETKAPEQKPASEEKTSDSKDSKQEGGNK